MADAPKRFTTVTSGGGTFTGGTLSTPLLLASGSAVAPGLAFASETGNNTGWYLLADNNIGFTANGALVMQMRNDGFYIVGSGADLSLSADNSLLIGTAGGDISQPSAGTPDQSGFWTGSTTNAWLIAETADKDFAFNHAAQTNPTLFIHSRNQSTTEFVGLTHTGGGAVINNQGTVALTEAGGAETVVTITTAAGQMSGGRISYTVRATDATDLVVRSGAFSFVCANAATVVTASLGATAQTDDGSVVIATGGATLTYAIAADVATANQLKITFNIDSSLVVSAASITYTVVLNGPGTVA